MLAGLEGGLVAYAEAQFDRIIFEEDREAVLAVQEAVREAVEPAGVTPEFNGDAEFPPIEQGTQELLGLLMALIVLIIGAALAIVIAWFAILMTGRYPQPLFNYVVGVGRWSLRVNAYAFLLVTDRYPPFSLKAG